MQQHLFFVNRESDMHDIERLKSLIGEENVLENEDMSRHTTFRAGGCAALFLTPDIWK